MIRIKQVIIAGYIFLILGFFYCFFYNPNFILAQVNDYSPLQPELNEIDSESILYIKKPEGQFSRLEFFTKGLISDQGKNNPQPSTRIVFGSIGEPSNLIPELSTDSSSSEINNLLYIAPLQYDKDLNVVTWAAKSCEVSDAGKHFKFELFPNILWEDGQELTADDVEFTYKLMIDPATPTAYAEMFLNIKEFKKTGKYTFEVFYDQPFARAFATFMQPILPKHALEGQDLLTTSFIRKPLSSGPYILKEWVAGTRLVLTANPKYFEGRPYIDEVIYRIIPDSTTMFMELKTNNIDLMGLTAQQYTRQTDSKMWKEKWRKYKHLAFAYTYLGYNLKHPFFSDIKVRQAIAHAIDKEGIVQGVLLGQGLSITGPYKPGTWAYNTEIKPYVYDLNKAKELLNQAGFEDINNDGILEKDNKPFSFTILTNQGNSDRIKVATIIQYQLAQVGIKVDIRTIEWAAFINEFIDKRNFEAVLLGWTIPQDPDSFDIWHSSKIANKGLNFMSYSNQEVDKILEQARVSFNQNERKKLYDRFQEILHEEQPYCFLYAPDSLLIINAKIQGIQPAPAGVSYNFNDWWFLL